MGDPGADRARQTVGQRSPRQQQQQQQPRGRQRQRSLQIDNDTAPHSRRRLCTATRIRSRVGEASRLVKKEDVVETKHEGAPSHVRVCLGSRACDLSRLPHRAAASTRPASTRHALRRAWAWGWRRRDVVASTSRPPCRPSDACEGGPALKRPPPPRSIGWEGMPGVVGVDVGFQMAAAAASPGHPTRPSLFTAVNLTSSLSPRLSHISLQH